MTTNDDRNEVSTTRRQFLEMSGRSAAASALLAAAAQPVHAAEDNTIRLALVGCGGRGTGAVNNALSTQGGPVKLFAMADLFEQRLGNSLNALNRRFSDQVDVPTERRFLGFDAYRKAIDCLRPGDVVLLTTHAAFRPMMFEYAVEKGINVFAEKSFATDGPNLRRWLAAASLSEEKNLKVGVGFMWRHSKARQEVIKRIHDGEIGDVHTLRIYRVQSRVHCPLYSGDDSELAFQIKHPNAFRWLSGGLFVDWHCHNVDVACWTKGAWPVSAQGFGGRCYEQAGNQCDHYTVEYDFPDGTKLFAFSRYMPNCWQTYSDYAHGSKGSAVLMESLRTPGTRIYRSQQMVEDELAWEYTESEPDPYVVEWQKLLDAIRQDTLHNEARRAGEADAAALMGRIATHTGQYITWDQVMQSKHQFVEDIDAMTFDTPAPIQASEGGLYPGVLPGVTTEC
jgi:predicted dehydrogenase